MSELDSDLLAWNLVLLWSIGAALADCHSLPPLVTQVQVGLYENQDKWWDNQSIDHSATYCKSEHSGQS